MKTEDLFPSMPAPPVAAHRTMNWIPTILAGGLGFVVAVVAVAAFHTRSVELTRTQASLRSAQATVTSQAADLATTRADLASAKSSLNSAQSDLSSAQGALEIALRCANSALHAWSSTTYLSYTFTGLALQRAVNSPACQAVRTAQLSSGPSS